MADLIFKAGFLNSGGAATGLTVTVNVYRITLSSAAVSQVVTAGAAAEIGSGMYLYRLAGADLSLYNYVAAFQTAGTADQTAVWCEGLVVPGVAFAATGEASANVTLWKGAPAPDAPPTKAEMDDAFRVSFVFDPDTAGMTYDDLIDEIEGADGDNLKVLSEQLDGVLAASGGATAEEIDVQLSSTHGAGAWGEGVGAFSVVYTARVDGLPAAGVYCRLSTDAAGLNNVDAGTTDGLGQVTFYHNLPSGTPVFIRRSKAGVQFVDPDSETIP